MRAAGHLADNVAHFARALRRAGMRVGPADTLVAIEAIRAGGIGSREDFFWTLHAVFVSRREDAPVFAEAFRLFWRSRELVERMLALFSSQTPAKSPPPEPKAGARRVSDALEHGGGRRPDERPTLEIDARLTVSADEVFRRKDFAQMSASELREARAAVARMAMPDDRVAARRFRARDRGPRFDARRTLRLSLRTGGDLMLPRFREARTVHPPLVVIADISGSMSQYSRLMLHFMHAMSARRRVRAFLFGTRLTPVTRQLARRDPDEAVAACGALVQDWAGGTRIGAALEEFNRRWSRRVLSGGPVVLLVTDGLERDDMERLSREADRLHRSCRRLIWLNPLLRYDGFSPRARGVRALLPHVDEFRSAHSLDTLSELCAALSGERSSRTTDPRAWLRAGEAA
ncbi:VWA domain-containing protein [Aureimonas flava]|uniref:VWA domain-containing protein n=1 Tax=Aureimonas flava TaxID=2320271 RepID=A0A3A1WRE0_9HYPH|nr:VWA domain-containing protein [Aureimonas flava]RIY03643.1 VWA domain-containing protein [Aureimonas flava]